MSRRSFDTVISVVSGTGEVFTIIEGVDLADGKQFRKEFTKNVRVADRLRFNRMEEWWISHPWCL